MEIGSTGISHLSETYAAMLGEIIIKSNIGRQQLDPKKEMPIAISVWYEVLFGVVPENRLNDCYLHVARHRGNTFPWKPEEIAAAWTSIRQAEFYKRAPDSHRLMHGFCEKCNNTGNEVIRDAFGNSKGARPCKH